MTLRRFAKTALAATPLPELLLRSRTKRFVTVLGYHRILPPPGEDYPFNEDVISATPEEFARELKYLKTHFDVISTRELLAALASPSLMPRRPAVITFDDGYVDNHAIAYPLLRDAGLSACFFLCTAIVGSQSVPWQEAWVFCMKRSSARQIPSPFGPDDPPYALDKPNRAASISRFRQHARKLVWSQVPICLERLEQSTGVSVGARVTEPLFMSWDAVRQLAAGGMEIGGHTRRHPALSLVDDPAVLREEVRGCYEDLSRELTEPPLAFAYPFGYAEYMSDQADREIELAGFGVSFSFIHGFSPRHSAARFRLPRIHASHGNDFRAFRLQMATAPGATMPWVTEHHRS
jgi:peptidoglycan/xylan/chitin deacetylase (PgdA/CDA1 family)